MRVLLTGIGGFIGSHVLEYFLEKTDWDIVGIDSFRHKGTYSRLDSISYDPKRVTIVRHDLTAPIDRPLENQLMGRTLTSEGHIDIIINMASDSAVERSITDPVTCWRNNCELGINMLEFARKTQPKVYFNFSTDEVYGDCTGDPHKEWDVILPSNVYAASKAAQEVASIGYWRTYDVPVVILNVMNCIAERQDKEKFLPKLIWKIATDQVMEIYGEEGKIGSRYYIHAKNIADALIFLSGQKVARYSLGATRPDRYNIVGDVEMDNLQAAKLVAEIMGKELKYRLIPSESARPGYDKRYALDGSKMAGLGWKHPLSTREAIEQIVKWTLEHPHWVI